MMDHDAMDFKWAFVPSVKFTDKIFWYPYTIANIKQVSINVQISVEHKDFSNFCGIPTLKTT